MLDYVYLLRNCKSAKTGGPLGESTLFNYFLKTMVFLNDRGIAKYVAKEDWVGKKVAGKRRQAQQEQKVLNLP
jgi:hypothetical protein